MKLVIDKKELNIIYADSFKKKLLGLMGQKNISHGIFFPKINSIKSISDKEVKLYLYSIIDNRIKEVETV